MRLRGPVSASDLWKRKVPHPPAAVSAPYYRRMAAVDVIIVGQLPPPLHGSNVICNELIESLKRSGISSQLVDKRFSTEISHVGRPSLEKVRRVLPFFVRAGRARNKQPSAVVYFISLTPGAFLVDAACIRVMRKRLKGQMVLYVHGVGFRGLYQRGKVFQRAIGTTFGSADHVVVLADELKDDVEPFCEQAEISVITNPAPGPDPGRFEPPKRPRQFLFLSNLLPGKGADVFLQAAEILAAERPEARFVLAGHRHEAHWHQYLMDLASAPNLRGRVTFVGGVNEDDKQLLFSQSAALVLPSRNEAAPLVVLEAKRVGRPVLASTVGALPTLVRDGIDGLLINSYAPKAWALAMRRVMDSPTYVADWGLAARRDYEQRFAKEPFDREWKRILADGRRPREAPICDSRA